MYGFEVNFITVVKIFSQINISVVFKHAFKIRLFTKVCYYLFRYQNCQLSPMQLVQKVEVTRGQHGYIDVKLILKFHCSLDS